MLLKGRPKREIRAICQWAGILGLVQNSHMLPLGEHLRKSPLIIYSAYGGAGGAPSNSEESFEAP